MKKAQVLKPFIHQGIFYLSVQIWIWESNFMLADVGIYLLEYKLTVYHI